MKVPGAPVFYDPSGRRRRRFALGVAAFVALLLLATTVFAASIGLVPVQPLLPVANERGPQALTPPHDTLFKRTRRTIDWYARRLTGETRARTAKDAGNVPLAIGFHTPWEKESGDSLRRHIDDLDWVIPGWVQVTGPNHHITIDADPVGRQVINAATRRPLILPMIQNALNAKWDVPGTVALLHDPRQRKAFLDWLEPWLAANHAGGAFFDFEQLPPSAQADYLAFLNEANTRFDKHNWLIAMAVPVGEPAWNVSAYAKIVDRVFLMAYDEHETTSDPGPVASQAWFARSIADAARGVPASKLVVAIGNYGYDWTIGSKDPGANSAVTVEEAWQSARDSDAMPAFDKASGNSGFAYEEDDGSKHVVWFLDAASAYNQIAFLRRAGIGGVALWRLGAEDPGLWSIFGRSHAQLPPASTIEPIPPGTERQIEGRGEILRIVATPAPGHRRVTTAKDGTIADVAFDALPSQFLIRRDGARPKEVALTFDDGPDPDWTPQILDVLKKYQVAATFFIVGENALTERHLLERIVAEGHEVGSHTYTHPNLAGASETDTDIQLNATQRLFQAFTGRSLKFFRAPYFGDAEPTTADELGPVLRAQEHGYISVGLHVDAEDWQRPGVQAIVDNVVNGVTKNDTGCEDGDDSACSHNIVLLHDAGGDRAQTVEALPIIIERLRALGYTFVPVSQLAGLSRDQAMPPISPSDRRAAEVDLFLFGTLGAIVIGLGWLFVFAISIGILRAVLLSALALIQARRELRTVFPAIDPARFVTVMIPAFNEEAVIERSVRTVLASTDVQIEVIVIDDGSKDRTSAIVAAAFADEPRVRLLTLENGGKARALNQGLALAKGEIVIALDADTQFEPTTIARLARWFADPRIGAVAGNAKVGNRVNLVTRWQALEYITAQNLERRALSSLNAMMVVPGAVGAWRLAAIREVGGYPHDTLAEDQDLTIAIQRAGWRVTYDQYAVAWTESPETFRGLAKQRFRWAYGTLQCLWKHGRIVATGRPRGLAWIGVPQAVLFQVVLAAISPIIDLALIISIVTTWLSIEAHGWAQTQTSLDKMFTYWLIFTAIDLLSAIVAFALERRAKWRLLWLLIPQRIGYRQIMYYVVLKALTQALRGPSVGWGKLQRTGRVEAR
ncbi:MAG: glycosyltransferase [Sphingomonas sp.]|uniref:glycosyltransferase n=1 Tax=Sphingomonas sp. TaxID=28214 RepID=UPI00121F7D34|nr:glycosyltransferase [Sphingomonas sp.]THD37776.1 MAG: glycosyltransferase [Sphingomonas sp.]